MAFVLRVKNLTKYYGADLGVKNLGLEIKEGEVVGLIGPNGSGKTTTIQLVAGIIRPTSGEVKICNYSMNLQPVQAKSKLGLIPDETGMIDKLTAREFIEVIGRIYGLSSSIIEKRMEHFLKVFDILDQKDNLLEGFSHGMRKKVQIITALIHNPKLFLFDEPTAGLDPEMIVVFKNLIKLLKKKNTGSLLATHYLTFAEEICDRFYILKDGEILIHGTAEQIFEKTSTRSLEEAFLTLSSPFREEDLSEMVDNL
jgi:ABC-2 type transport system ATP-binding protein